MWRIIGFLPASAVLLLASGAFAAPRPTTLRAAEFTVIFGSRKPSAPGSQVTCPSVTSRGPAPMAWVTPSQKPMGAPSSRTTRYSHNRPTRNRSTSSSS